MKPDTRKSAATEIAGQKGTEARVQELNRLLVAIREINKLIVREREPQELLAKTCALLVKKRGYALVWVGLPGPEPMSVIPAARAGRQAAYLETASVTSDESPAGQGPVGTAIRTRRPCLCQDTAEDPRFAPWRIPALAHGLASVAAVPMIQGGRVLGALAVYADRTEAFHEEEVALLIEVAEDLAFALQSIEHEKERLKAEARLQLVNTALEASANAIAITDREGLITWANPAFTQLTGYSFAELRGRKPNILKSGAQNKAFFHTLWETILAGRVWRSEMVNRRKDGRLYTVESTITPVRSEGGEITHFIAVKQDVTERKRAEAALQQSERKFRTYIEKAPIAVFVSDHEGRFTDCNPAAVEMLGYDDATLKGMHALDIHPENERARVGQALTVLQSQGYIEGEFRMKRADGQVIWGALSVGLIGMGHALGYCQDITERKRAEVALQRSEEEFRAMFEVASIGMAQADLQTGQWRRVNQSMCAITGYSADELLQMRVPDITHPEDRQRDWELFQRVVRGDAPDYHLEKRYLRKDGAVAWVNVNMTVLRNASGQPTRTMATIEDITERKHLEAQLRQAQKMEAIGQLAGGVAHDFNNLLAIMRGNADLILMDADQLPPQTNECLKHIAAAAERAATLTRQLLIFSRKQAMQARPLMLNELVQNLTKMLTRVIREDIHLECRYGEPLPFVQADSGMLEQVLLNLVVNARDAMPGGGQLLITTEVLSLHAADAQSNPDARPGEYVGLSVRDAGTGIAPEHLQRIFEPFFTTKEPGKGTGLGLATVYGIVKQHHGWVEVSTLVGEGTTFRVLLPTIPPPAKPEPTAAESGLRGGSETILLVEDDFSVRMITRRVLEMFHYKVHEATSAREAFSVWSRHAAEISLVLSDVIMPEGVSGRDLAKRLRAEKPALKVILMSGHSAETVGKDTEFFRRTGSYFLQKPCPTATLIQTVRKCLDEKSPGGL